MSKLLALSLSSILTYATYDVLYDFLYSHILFFPYVFYEVIWSFLALCSQGLPTLILRFNYLCCFEGCEKIKNCFDKE